MIGMVDSVSLYRASLGASTGKAYVNRKNSHYAYVALFIGELKEDKVIEKWMKDG
jgi:hypothetical protein